jgi:hypothetical protein
MSVENCGLIFTKAGSSKAALLLDRPMRGLQGFLQYSPGCLWI